VATVVSGYFVLKDLVIELQGLRTDEAGTSR